jgi:ferric-dicitrate binding protein FerR (iron transport regulator)
MMKNLNSLEDILEDESFQAWFFKNDERAAAEWENWMALNPVKRSLVEKAVEFMNELKIEEAAISDSRIAKAYEGLERKIDNAKAPVISMPRRHYKWWLSAAAAVLVIVGLIGVWELVPRKSSVNAQYGQTYTKQLPDGSTMMLNANSTAKLGEEWKDCDREVWLKGEAFFHVKKTPTKNRFIVHTNELDIIVTGTQFNVWTRDNKTSVLLTEGSVTIKTADGKETKMVPGDFIEINNKNLEKRKINEESVLAWKDNKILFDDTPMHEVCRIIREHYGVKVTILDSTLNSLTIGGMMENDNLDVLLKSLEATNDFKIIRKENEIFISKP